MDSLDPLDFGNLTNLYRNQSALRLPQSYGENSGDFDDVEYPNPTFSLAADTKSRIFIGPNSDDDDRYKFFMVCAENKINALIERVREFNDNFERPEEFENEAVSMAIQQHGLRKNDTQNISHEYGIHNSLNKSNKLESDSDVPTTSNDSKNHMQKDDFDVDDIYFLNEAVAAAIEQKGLSSSMFSVSN
ncbi:UNVERIFIED_CONTAM: hypothetical protein PYX00_008114 [Menopon gallinae]|uniref:MAT1-2-1 n=1 Tax=Menopon gallinae TaxID=328185 RepID=A0AAW2HLR7_9NEOP